MHLFFYCVWIPGVLLQLLLLIRGWRSANLRHFPFFYAYILAGTVTGLAAFAILKTDVQLYTRFYWLSQFFTLIVGCGLVLEIFEHVLSSYAGPRKFARSVCLATFGAILFFGLLYARVIRSEAVSTSEIQIERDIRAAQILLFMAILAVIAYYQISLNKNMHGMIQGYGLYLGGSLASLALRAYMGPDFNSVWNAVQPILFDISLVIWLFAFWAYVPDASAASSANLEVDYEALVATTKQAVNSMRTYVARAIRS